MKMNIYDIALELDKRIASYNRDAKENKANQQYIEANGNYSAIVALLDFKMWLEEVESRHEKGE